MTRTVSRRKRQRQGATPKSEQSPKRHPGKKKDALTPERSVLNPRITGIRWHCLHEVKGFVDDANRGTNHSLFESVKGEIILEVLILSAGSPAQAELFPWRFSRRGCQRHPRHNEGPT